MKINDLRTHAADSVIIVGPAFFATPTANPPPITYVDDLTAPVEFDTSPLPVGASIPLDPRLECRTADR